METLALMIKYYDEGLSPYEIAEKLNTYPNNVRRKLKKAGKVLRDKSAAQSQAIKSGRHKHPTKGTVRSSDTKLKISEKVYSYWQNLPDEIREQRAEQSRLSWDNMTDKQKEKLRKSAAEGIRVASKDGSKIEKYLRKNLTEEGFDVIFHKQGLIVNDKLEVDMFVPSAKTVIEIDGPTHFLPIWGDESLKKHIKADLHKNGLLLGAGYAIIRVKYLVKNLSEKNKRDLSAMIIPILRKFEKTFPEPNNRYIELELGEIDV